MITIQQMQTVRAVKTARAREIQHAENLTRITSDLYKVIDGMFTGSTRAATVAQLHEIIAQINLARASCATTATMMAEVLELIGED